MNQNQTILKHLKRKGITTIEAVYLYKITCLAERCRDLRKKGYKIKSIPMHKNGKHFVKYVLGRDV